MKNYLTQTSKSINVLQILTLVCFTLALAVPVAAQECKQYALDIADPSTLKLKDGEHVIASLGTVAGKVEVRVTVKGGVVSPPWSFLNGKPFQKITESQIPNQIPKEVLGCMKKAEQSHGGWFADATSAILDWFVAPAYARCCRVSYSIGRALGGCYYVVAQACDDAGNCGYGYSSTCK